MATPEQAHSVLAVLMDPRKFEAMLPFQRSPQMIPDSTSKGILARAGLDGSS